jgi:oligopeptide/dipeptide ABC transporter ATP-binding protein
MTRWVAPIEAAGPSTPLLAVRNLSMEFVGLSRNLRAVSDVSFNLAPGQTCGIVGESGSGKTALALTIARLNPPQSSRVVSGRIEIEGEDVTDMSERAFRRLRGSKIGVIFQDPMTSLNPTLTVGEQIAEPARLHLGLGRKAAWNRAVDLIARVGIRRPAETARAYPHQLSGGMRQRIMIAIALVCEPRLLIADEPTTALDVTVQSQILDLINDLAAETGAAVILITHDLGVAARMCDRVSVMYAGRFVETGPVDAIFYHPSMPYTSALLQSIPRLGARDALLPIPGVPPRMDMPEPGCRFCPRCTHARPLCSQEEPALTNRGPMHQGRCWGTEETGWIAS